MKILRINQIVKTTGLSRSTIWRLERSNDFPARIQLSRNAIGWFEKEILAWLEQKQQPAARVDDKETLV